MVSVAKFNWFIFPVSIFCMFMTSSCGGDDDVDISKQVLSSIIPSNSEAQVFKNITFNDKGYISSYSPDRSTRTYTYNNDVITMQANANYILKYKLSQGLVKSVIDAENNSIDLFYNNEKQLIKVCYVDRTDEFKWEGADLIETSHSNETLQMPQLTHFTYNSLKISNRYNYMPLSVFLFNHEVAVDPILLAQGFYGNSVPRHALTLYYHDLATVNFNWFIDKTGKAKSIEFHNSQSGFTNTYTFTWK